MIRWLKIAKRALTASEDVQIKGWFTSRLIWVNLISLLGLVLVQFEVIPVPWPQEQVSEIALNIVGLVNGITIMLRFDTRTPVGPRTVRRLGASNSLGQDENVDT